MKKMMMVALMAAATTTALAQSEVVKNAKKLFDKGQFEEALKEIQPALNEGTRMLIRLRLGILLVKLTIRSFLTFRICSSKKRFSQQVRLLTRRP